MVFANLKRVIQCACFKSPVSRHIPSLESRIYYKYKSLQLSDKKQDQWWTSECQVQTRHWMPRSLAVKSATEAYEYCRQSVDHDSRQRSSVANIVDTSVLVSQRSAGDCEKPLTPGKSPCQSETAVFHECCENDRDTAEQMLHHPIAGGTRRLIIRTQVCQCHILGVVEPASL